MARSEHPRYTALDKAERAASRRRRPTVRRANTRHAVLALAIREG